MSDLPSLKPQRYKSRAALVTLCLSHLPFHPSCFLGYGAAILAGRYDLGVIDLNAEIYFRYRESLKKILSAMDEEQVISDALLTPLYQEIDPCIDFHYAAVNWREYATVYITTPSWFPTVPTEAVLRLFRAIKRVSPNTKVFFFSNSLGSWTNREELNHHGVYTVHLNNLFVADGSAVPVRYDILPTPTYDHRDKYLFDLVPFMLKHGCSWGHCRFCSLSRGWNSGYLERSGRAVIRELGTIINQYDPAVLVCRDNSLNGSNLIEFCRGLQRFRKPWGGMCRADLNGKETDALRMAGCRVLFFGLESGSDRTLKRMNKGITSKQMSDFIKRLHSTGIFPAPSFVIGSPGERRADFEQTLRFLGEHRQYFDVVNVYPFMATPASEFGSLKKEPHKDVATRLYEFIQKCEELELKVCVGEQCAEYILFRRISKC